MGIFSKSYQLHLQKLPKRASCTTALPACCRQDPTALKVQYFIAYQRIQSKSSNQTSLSFPGALGRIWISGHCQSLVGRQVWDIEWEMKEKGVGGWAASMSHLRQQRRELMGSGEASGRKPGECGCSLHTVSFILTPNFPPWGCHNKPLQLHRLGQSGWKAA